MECCHSQIVEIFNRFVLGALVMGTEMLDQCRHGDAVVRVDGTGESSRDEQFIAYFVEKTLFVSVVHGSACHGRVFAHVPLVGTTTCPSAECPIQVDRAQAPDNCPYRIVEAPGYGDEIRPQSPQQPSHRCRADKGVQADEGSAAGCTRARRKRFEEECRSPGQANSTHPGR
ncbi:hypothetical protein RE2895_61160 (plasmid) [Rhodococcus erythropolis]|nr:hypothetical protein RE2895_61160 [Rhodococcus erythropolis]